METQEKISIDVVLLLPENVNDICKKFKKESDKKDYASLFVVYFFDFDGAGNCKNTS